MPRYRLDGECASAWSPTCTSSAQGPGRIGDSQIELATIVSANAPAPIAQPVLRWCSDSPTSSTADRARSSAGRRPRGATCTANARAHVATGEWNLSIWSLRGPRQLARAARETISGTAALRGDLRYRGRSDWSVVHAFCESHELPCILPVTDLPVESGSGHYTLYYSAGVRLEARVTARNIAADAADPDGRILAAARRRRARARGAGRPLGGATWPRSRGLTTKAIAPESAPTSQRLDRRLRRERPEVLVAWLMPALSSGPSPPIACELPRHLAAPHLHGLGVHRLARHSGPARSSSKASSTCIRIDLAAAGTCAISARGDNWLRQQDLSGLDQIPPRRPFSPVTSVGEAMAAHGRQLFTRLSRRDAGAHARRYAG